MAGTIFAIGELAYAAQQYEVSLCFDFLALGFYTAGAILAKVSVCLSMWHLVTRPRRFRRFQMYLLAQIGFLLVVASTYSFAALTTCPEGAITEGSFLLLGTTSFAAGWTARECWDVGIRPVLDVIQQGE